MSKAQYEKQVEEGKIIDVTTRKKTHKQQWRDKINKEEYKCMKAKKPFCRRCARLDGDEQAEHELKRRNKPEYKNSTENVPISLALEMYSKPTRFEFVRDDKPVKIYQTINGITKKIETGEYWHEYKCKICGANVSIADVKQK